MLTIKNARSLKVLNSRGDWTIKTYLETEDGFRAWAMVPEGASKGEMEAVCLEAERAVDVLTKEIASTLQGKKFSSQQEFDEFLIELDGTKNKSRLGGNTILSLSAAFSRVYCKKTEQPLQKYLNNVFKQALGDNKLSTKKEINITPLFNILNGGKHAQNNLSFQEFMVIPAKKYSINQCLEIGRTVYKSLKNKLEKDGYSTGVGDEGGFAPLNFTVKKALKYIKECVGENYKVGEDVFMGMDIAAESFYHKGKYEIKEEKLSLTPDEFKNYLTDLTKEFELIYMEDVFHEDDSSHWKAINSELGDKLMISADDLVVTNPLILSKAISEKLANTVIVKPNQVGTIWETLRFVAEARIAGWNVVVSHRSGDTEDHYIADLACAVESDFVKFGAVDRGERTSKFNRLLELWACKL